MAKIVKGTYYEQNHKVMTGFDSKGHDDGPKTMMSARRKGEEITIDARLDLIGVTRQSVTKLKSSAHPD